MALDLKLDEEPTRDATLHCKISTANKKWLVDKAARLNRHIGAILERFLTSAREADAARNTNKARVR